MGQITHEQNKHREGRDERENNRLNNVTSIHCLASSRSTGCQRDACSVRLVAVLHVSFVEAIVCAVRVSGPRVSGV